MRALLIGCDFYPPGAASAAVAWPCLSACAGDVRRMDEWLRGSADVPAERIRKLTASMPPESEAEPPEPPAERPSYENIVHQLLLLTQEAAPGEQILIYYAGHGGRVPTWLPAVKGSAGIDEALVPFDIGAAGARYLRDVEIAEILRALVERGAFVTLALDCCHAGGATRLPLLPAPAGIGVRGSGVVDTAPRPRDSLVAPPERLAATWRSGGSEAVRGLAAGSGWLPRPRGYVLLAACRAAELAYEFPFDGREKSGVFTRALLAGLRGLVPGCTYRRLHDRIVAEVHGRFELQTPVVEGEADRVVFGAERRSEEPAVNVLRVEGGGRRLLLGAGRAQGVERRSRFAVYPADVRQPGRAPERAAVVQVTAAGATDAWTRLVERRRQAALEPGARAVQIDPGAPRLRRGVGLVAAQAAEGRSALEAVAEILACGGGRGFVGAAREGSGPDFLVSVSPEGYYEIRDPAGVPLPQVPLLAIGAPDAAERLVEHLIHLARFRNVQRLDNRDLRSPLRGALAVELGGLPEGWDPEAPPVFLPDPERSRAVACGEWICVRIANTSRQVLNLGVLDLQPDWGITQIFPSPEEGDFATLEPGQDLLLPLLASLPEGLAAGTDLLKVVAAAGVAGFRWLELPALGAPSSNGLGRRRLPGDPLAALFAALTAERVSTRALEPARYAGREWTVAHLEIRMTRPAPAGGEAA